MNRPGTPRPSFTRFDESMQPRPTPIILTEDTIIDVVPQSSANDSNCIQGTPTSTVMSSTIDNVTVCGDRSLKAPEALNADDVINRDGSLNPLRHKGPANTADVDGPVCAPSPRGIVDMGFSKDGLHSFKSKSSKASASHESVSDEANDRMAPLPERAKSDDQDVPPPPPQCEQIIYPIHCPSWHVAVVAQRGCGLRPISDEKLIMWRLLLLIFSMFGTTELIFLKEGRAFITALVGVDLAIIASVFGIRCVVQNHHVRDDEDSGSPPW